MLCLSLWTRLLTPYSWYACVGDSHEAVELRDDDKKVYMGKGVLKAVSNINDKIAPALLGMDPTQQAKIDKVMMELDKTDNKVHIYLWEY